ncbi:uncharacterized protein LOC105065942 [Camelus bactrianus]|uniref:uncharacterized protein LOC105065942 n=1 Tax=Camelus bactrianus TaxID=9837 RepID=UPI003D6FAB16
MNKINEIPQFPEGFRIEASKNQYDASKMFIGGISRSISKQALFEYLKQFGEILDFIIKIHPDTGITRGFGFVLFKDNATIEKVLQVKEHKVDGKKIDLKRAKALESKFSYKKVFVGGLNPQLSEEKIREYFEAFGVIESIELPVCPRTKERRAFCFITYTDETPVKKLLETRYHLVGSGRCEVKIAFSRKQAKAKYKAERDGLSTRLGNRWGGTGSQANPNPCGRNPDRYSANPDPCGINPNPCGINPNPCGINPNPCAVNPDPCGINPVPYGANPDPCGINPVPYGANPDPCGINPVPYGANPDPCGINPVPYGANPDPCGINPVPYGANPDPCGINPVPYGANPNPCGINPNPCGINPDLHGINADPRRVNPDPCGINPSPFGINPNLFGINPNPWGAIASPCGASPNAFGAVGGGRSPSTVFVPVPFSANNEGFNFSDQMYGNVHNPYNDQPVFNTYGGEYFPGCTSGPQAFGNAFTNYNVQINQAAPYGSGYQGIYQPF